MANVTMHAAGHPVNWVHGFKSNIAKKEEDVAGLQTIVYVVEPKHEVYGSASSLHISPPVYINDQHIEEPGQQQTTANNNDILAAAIQQIGRTMSGGKRH